MLCQSQGKLVRSAMGRATPLKILFANAHRHRQYKREAYLWAHMNPSPLQAILVYREVGHSGRKALLQQKRYKDHLLKCPCGKSVKISNRFHRTALQQTLRDNPATCPLAWKPCASLSIQHAPRAHKPNEALFSSNSATSTILPCSEREHTAHSFDKNPLMSLEPCPSLVKRLHCIVCSFMLQHHKQIWL